jgi:hypothetical protein
MEGIAPILHVADARASVDWYAQLGFEVESEQPSGQTGRCMCGCGAARHSCICPSTASTEARPATSICTSKCRLPPPAGRGGRGVPVGHARGQADRPGRQRRAYGFSAPEAGTGSTCLIGAGRILAA